MPAGRPKLDTHAAPTPGIDAPPASWVAEPEPESLPEPKNERALDLEAPASGDPTRARSATKSALFELDVPTQNLRAPAPQARSVAEDKPPPPPEESAKSTMEFLYEIDAPTRATSREMDLELDPELATALADAGVRNVVPTEAAEPELSVAAGAPTPASEPPGVDLPLDIGVLLPAPERPQTAAEQHEQRLRRAIVRIQTCRDSFRLMGFLGVADSDRKGVARMFMELEAAIGRPADAPSPIKDPDTALAGASKEQLDTIERQIGPIEDRLLLLDQTVARDSFQQACSTRKVTRKILVRYGRLLASRRFQADERRNRFEWIATQLLAPLDSTGVRRPLTPEQSRPVLLRLIGGLPYKAKEQELLEALAYLRDSITRVHRFASPTEFFESGYYVDVHGYKVTMRDQLLVPEFLFFSVQLNAAVHNRVEVWIRDLERLHNSSQLRQEGAPREQIMRGLQAQEEAVESALGVKRRSTTQTVARAEAPSKSEAEAKAPPKAKPKRKKKERKDSPRFEIIWDRNMIVLVGSVIVILGVTAQLLTYTGVVGQETVQAMTVAQMQEMSPLIARAWLVGDGDSRHVRATVVIHRWDKTEPRKRREVAEHILATLTAKGVKNAEIKRGPAIVIRIADGYLVEVAGGKL